MPEESKVSDNSSKLTAKHISAARPKIVAVDGPAGSGKSSICAKVCRDIGWSYVNTGALYRSVGLLAAESHVPLVEGPELTQFLQDFCQKMNSSNMHIF